MLEHDDVVALLEQYFYAGLLGVLVIASLGIPIPEDIPLIAAGVILRLHPEVASWPGALLTAWVGIMSGDLVLYRVGRMWGHDVVKHRSVRWIITPARFNRACDYFRKYGTWFCFFGRFIVGIRAVMCMTAGATRFPYWRFFLADCAGAVLSIPLFVGLGYAFAPVIETLYSRLAEVQGLLIVVGVVLVALFIAYEVRKHRRLAKSDREAEAALAKTADPSTAAASTPGKTTRGTREPVEADA